MSSLGVVREFGGTRRCLAFFSCWWVVGRDGFFGWKVTRRELKKLNTFLRIVKVILY